MFRRVLLGVAALLVLLGTGTVEAQPGALDFAFVIDNAAPDFYDNIVTDDDGNIYTTGQFRGTVDFDPGPGTVSRTSTFDMVGANGQFDEGFVAKYDPNGNLLFVYSVPGYGELNTKALALTSTGDILLAGEYETFAAIPGEEIDFDPSVSTYHVPSLGDRSVFLLRLNPSGNFVSFQTWPTRDFHGLATDRFDNIYIAGVYNGGVFDADPGPGTHLLPPAPSEFPFIVKLNPSGDFVYGHGFATTFGTYIECLTADPTGNLYLAGSFQATVDFDPGPGVQNLTAGTADELDEMFLLKLDPNGDFIAVRNLMDAADGDRNSPTAIDIDLAGNIYTTGYFIGSGDFDPGVGTHTLTTATNYNMFVSKLDSSFNLVYAHRLGGAERASGSEIHATPFGTAYIGGYFRGTVDFDPGAGTMNLSSAGAGIYDGVMIRLNADGSYNYAYNLMATGSTVTRDIHVDSAYQVYATGLLDGTADFDPDGVTSFPVTSADGFYLSKLGPEPTPPTPSAPLVMDIAPALQSTFTTPLFKVTFSEAVTGVDISDFVLNGTAGATVNSVTGNDATYFVAVAMSPLDGERVLLDLIDNDSIVSVGSATPLGGVGVGNGNFYDGTPIVVVHAGSTTGQGTLDYAFLLGDIESDSAWAIVADDDGNSYITGYFRGTVDFDPGTGIALLSSNGEYDIFVAKYDIGGNFVFAVSAGGTSYDSSGFIARSPDGNIYVTGAFRDTVDFDPGVGSALRTSAGESDAYLWILDENGAFVNCYTWGGTVDDRVGPVALDLEGNAHLSLNYESDNVDADPTGGTLILPNAMSRDTVLLKLDLTNGTLRYAYPLSSSLQDEIWALTTDREGNLLAAGFNEGSIDLDASAGTLPYLPGGYVLKLDPTGALLNAGQLFQINPPVDPIRIWHLTLDQAGSIYFCGEFNEEVDFDPADPTFHILDATGNGRDGFVAKWNQDFSFAYAHQFSSSDDDEVNSLVVDRFGGVILGGRFQEDLEMNPPGPTLATIAGSAFSDGFIIRFDPDGSRDYAYTLEATDDAFFTALALDAHDRLHLLGRLRGDGEFNSSLSTFPLTSNAGSRDIFVMQKNLSPPAFYANAPHVLSIRPQSGTKAIGDVIMEVVFTEDVTGVDISDFVLHGPGTGTITNVTGSGRVYLVTVSYDDQSGSLYLDLVDDDTIIGQLTSQPLAGPGAFNGNFNGNPIVLKGTPPAGLPLSSPYVLAALAIALLYRGSIALRRGRHQTVT